MEQFAESSPRSQLSRSHDKEIVASGLRVQCAAGSITEVKEGAIIYVKTVCVPLLLQVTCARIEVNAAVRSKVKLNY